MIICSPAIALELSCHSMHALTSEENSGPSADKTLTSLKMCKVDWCLLPLPYLSLLGSGLCPGCPLARLLGLFLLSLVGLAYGPFRVCTLLSGLRWIALTCCSTSHSITKAARIQSSAGDACGISPTLLPKVLICRIQQKYAITLICQLGAVRASSHVSCLVAALLAQYLSLCLFAASIRC